MLRAKDTLNLNTFEVRICWVNSLLTPITGPPASAPVPFSTVPVQCVHSASSARYVALATLQVAATYNLDIAYCLTTTAAPTASVITDRMQTVPRAQRKARCRCISGGSEWFDRKPSNDDTVLLGCIGGIISATNGRQPRTLANRKYMVCFTYAQPCSTGSTPTTASLHTARAGTYNMVFVGCTVWISRQTIQLTVRILAANTRFTSQPCGERN
jgi:hypothetical protein